MTLFQGWSETVPDLDHLQPFGCDAHVFIHPNPCTKSKPKAKHCISIGYNEHTTSQCCVWNRQRITTAATLDVRCNEQSYGGRDYIPIPDLEQWVLGLSDQSVPEQEQLVLDLGQSVAGPIDQVVPKEQEEPISSIDQ
jgi:hypothetical protein